MRPLFFLPPALVIGGAAAEPATAHLTAAQQRELVDRIADLVRDEYVFPDLAETAARALRQRAGSLADPASPEVGAFLERVNAALQELTGDRHLSVRIRIPRFDEPPPDLGLPSVRRLEGGLGYLRVDRFFRAEESRAVFDAALDQLAGCRAVVVDLRENRGGGDANALLASYFLPERTLVAKLLWRKQEAMEVWAGPTTRPALAKVPLYILVSGTTFSAGEAFAYALQQQGRAQVVGEPTRGGANPNRFFPLGHGLEVSISVGRTVNPLTGTSWEGRGVQPDRRRPAAKALEEVRALVTRDAPDSGGTLPAFRHPAG